MNKMRIIFFLLLITFGHFNYAEENTKNRLHAKDFTCLPYLTVRDIRNNGLVLVLDDGSQWDIKYFGGVWKLFGWGWTEQKEVSHWSIGDTIEIQYPNSGNLIDFVLVINNLSKQEKALANLTEAPSVDYPACLWVVNFDENTNLVTLSDGSVWFKTRIDMYGSLYKYKYSLPGKWEIGDAVTLLRGEGWWHANSFYLWNHIINEMPCVNRLE